MNTKENINQEVKEIREDRLAPVMMNAVESDDKVRKGAPLQNLVCGIDSGFGKIKVAYRDTLKGEVKIFNLDATVTEGECVDIEKTIYINDEAYDTLSYNKLSKTGNITKDNPYSILNMYRGLYELHKRTKTTNFIVGLGCSMDTAQSEEAKKSLRDRALKLRQIKVREHGQQEVTLNIQEVFIQPEGACSIFNIDQNKINRLDDNYIVDLGTLNSCITPYHKVPNIKSAISREFGYDSIVRGIMVKLKSQGINTKEEQVERIIENLSKQDKSIQKIVNEYVIKEFLEKTLKSQLVEVGYNQILGHKLIFTGGTSARFAPHIKKVFKNAEFTINPLYSNVIGMYIRTENMWAEQQKNHTENVGA